MADCLNKTAVSVLIFTLNEEVNLPSCLESLPWADQVIVVDSGSTDNTKMIAMHHGADFYVHNFTGFGDQRNWALENIELRNNWVLILDADERVPVELASEIHERLGSIQRGVAAFKVARRFYMWGRWLRFSGLYPTYVVRLINKEKVKYVNRGHAETQVAEGKILLLKSDLIDENQKGSEHWFERQNRYSTQEAAYEIEQEQVPLDISAFFSSEPMTRRTALKRVASLLPFRPMLYFIYSYILKLGFIEGRDGYLFCQMKASYQRMIVVKKHEIRKQRNLLYRVKPRLQ